MLVFAWILFLSLQSCKNSFQKQELVSSQEKFIRATTHDMASASKEASSLGLEWIQEDDTVGYKISALSDVDIESLEPVLKLEKVMDISYKNEFLGVVWNSPIDQPQIYAKAKFCQKDSENDCLENMSLYNKLIFPTYPGHWKGEGEISLKLCVSKEEERCSKESKITFPLDSFSPPKNRENFLRILEKKMQIYEETKAWLKDIVQNPASNLVGKKAYDVIKNNVEILGVPIFAYNFSSLTKEDFQNFSQSLSSNSTDSEASLGLTDGVEVDSGTCIMAVNESGVSFGQSDWQDEKKSCNNVKKSLMASLTILGISSLAVGVISIPFRGVQKIVTKPNSVKNKSIKKMPLKYFFAAGFASLVASLGISFSLDEEKDARTENFLKSVSEKFYEIDALRQKSL